MNATVTKMTWRGYTVDFTNPYHFIIRSPEGYLRYELPKKYNTTQDCIDTINRDIEISEQFRPSKEAK